MASGASCKSTSNDDAERHYATHINRRDSSYKAEIQDNENIDDEYDWSDEDNKDIHNDVVLDLNKHIVAVRILGDRYIDENGYFTKEVEDMVNAFIESYNSTDSTTHGEIEYHRKVISKLLVTSTMIKVCCEIVSNTYSKGWTRSDGGNDDRKFDLLARSLGLIANFSICYAKLAVEVANMPMFAECVKLMLEEYLEVHLNSASEEEHDEDDEETDEDTEGALSIVKSCILIVYNMVLVERNQARLMDLKFAEVLQPYLKSAVTVSRLLVLASLASLIDESQSEIINTNKDSVKFFLDNLAEAMKNQTRTSFGWTCMECGLVVCKLARNDANKKLLVDLGALELLVELGRTGNQEEQYESVSALWELSFGKNDDIRKKMVEDEDIGVVELLIHLKHSNTSRIRKMCNGALWTLRNELSCSRKYKEMGKLLSTHDDVQNTAQTDRKKGSTFKYKGHIMMSYQWADQTIVKTIRDHLQSAGHKVWMDIDQMGGSTVGAMANAVENAGIIMTCISQKYKNSQNCRAEAEYAFQLKKTIIPLKMEPNYKADGWLGLICGTKLYFEFSGKYPFDSKLQELLKTLEKTT